VRSHAISRRQGKTTALHVRLPTQQPDIAHQHISDNNRLWLSTGLSYKATDKLTFDLGYTYIAVNKARINYNGTTPTPGGLLLTADAKPSIHVVSAGLTYRWDDPTVAQAVVSKSAPISVRY
jgi:opacity protein-like surface antigen